MVEKAVLEKELELSKKVEGGIPNKLPNKLKVQIMLELLLVLPLELLIKTLQIKRSSYYYAKKALQKNLTNTHIYGVAYTRLQKKTSLLMTLLEYG